MRRIIRERQEVLPFLKWAGGKRWLTSTHPSLFPDSYDRYIEPFLGSGAVFFRLAPRKALLSDSNGDLIATYIAIKENYELVRRYLVDHQRYHSNTYYYKVRAAVPRSRYARAARFIYLNRTCWNGLYRVNLNGEFNVPIGTKSSVLLQTDNFEAISASLHQARICCSDFEGIVSQAKAGDFVFLDPPYTVKHNLNGFVKYNEQIFSWEDQIRLRDALVAASRRGVSILLTNANHRSIRDLYRKEFFISTASRQSVIAASSDKRAITSELLVRNFGY